MADSSLSFLKLLLVPNHSPYRDLNDPEDVNHLEGLMSEHTSTLSQTQRACKNGTKWGSARAGKHKHPQEAHASGKLCCVTGCLQEQHEIERCAHQKTPNSLKKTKASGKLLLRHRVLSRKALNGARACTKAPTPLAKPKHQANSVVSRSACKKGATLGAWVQGNTKLPASRKPSAKLCRVTEPERLKEWHRNYSARGRTKAPNTLRKATTSGKLCCVTDCVQERHQILHTRAGKH